MASTPSGATTALVHIHGFAPDGTSINAMAASDDGTFVRVAREGDAVYRSTDAQK